MQIEAEQSRKTFGKDKCTAYIYKPGKQPGRKPKGSNTTIPALVLQIPPKDYKGFKTYTQIDNAQPARIKECFSQPDKSPKTGRKFIRVKEPLEPLAFLPTQTSSVLLSR